MNLFHTPRTALIQKHRAAPEPGRTQTDFDAVCFDVGDTLLTDVPGRHQRISAALADCGIEIDPAWLRRCVADLESRALQMYLAGSAGDSPEVLTMVASGLLRASHREPTPAAVSKLIAAYAEQKYERRLDPDAPSLLNALRALPVKLGIISDWDESLEDVLRDLNCRQLFDSVSVSAIVGVNKPNPLLFQDALAKLGVTSGRAAHVGDYFALDVAGARAAGMQAVLFDRGTGHTTPTAGCPVVHSFDELSDLLLPTSVS